MTIIDQRSATAEGITIRPIAEEEALARAFVTGYAFSEDRGEKLVAGFARAAPLTWTRGLFQDGRLIASLLLLPYTLRLEGRELRMGGIADVACLPEHRRRGHVGRLLRSTLRELHEAGTPLSGLYTPHVPLYRRFGWEVASWYHETRFAIKRTPLRPASRPAGHAERVDDDAWQRLDAIYNAVTAGHNSALHRSEARWRWNVLRLGERPLDVAVWVGADGADRGYAVYRETGWQNNQRGNLFVHELHAVDGESYRGLLDYLLTHDLSQDIICYGSGEIPLLSILDDPAQAETKTIPGLLLRLVDLPAALAARACYAARELMVVLDVRDTACDWNAGTWRIANEGGVLRATPTSAAADLALDISMLATLYNGGRTPEALALAGLIEVASADALGALHDLLAMRLPPTCMEIF